MEAARYAATAMTPPTHHRAVALVLAVVLAVGLVRLRARRALPPPVQQRSLEGPHAEPDGHHGDAQRNAASRPEAHGPPDPNVADAAALERLPGIGPALAARILAARAAGLTIRCPEDLRQIRGIGARTLARLAPRMRFPRCTEDGDAGATGPR